MSNSVFPTLPGITWPKPRLPTFRTGVTESTSGREVRTAYQLFPKWEFRLQIDILRAGSLAEYETLLAFFLNMGGMYDSFLYTDANDSSVTDHQFGIGDGSKTQFQLVRTLTGGSFSFSEPVANVNTLTNIKQAGTPVVAGAGAGKYQINSAGLVTFGTAPTSGAALTWTGTYYFRCRLMNDAPNFSEFMSRLWELKDLRFIGALGNKV